MNVDEVYRRSKLLYGNRSRLAIAAYIADCSTVVSAREIARDLGLPDSVVHPEMQRFAAAGLLERLPRVTQSQLYERLDDPYWSHCASEWSRLRTEATQTQPTS